MDYGKNSDFWGGEYYAPNVESFIFRFFSRILKYDFGIDGSKSQRIFDFGCGQGAALYYFSELGFRCFGVDIAKKDIEIAQTKDEHGLFKPQFELIQSKPFVGQRYFETLFEKNEWIDVAISIQTLDFLSNTDCEIVLNNIHTQMNKGGIIYASHNGTKNYYLKHGEYVGDGLYHINLNNGRVQYDAYMNFIDSEEGVLEKFHMFKPLYIDYYDSSFRNEGSEFRWTFTGVKA